MAEPDRAGNQTVEVDWNEAARAWHLHGAPSGPAGHAMTAVAGLTWYADWARPDQVVEVFVETLDGTASAPLDERALALLGHVCGTDVAEALAVGSRAGAGASFELVLPAESSGRRRAVGRLGRVVAERRWAGGSSWWSVEGVARCHELGIEPDDLDIGDPAEMVDDAFDLVDSLPEALVELLVADGLGPRLRAPLDACDLPEHELPAPLRLASSAVDRRFAELVDSGALGRPDLTADAAAEGRLAPAGTMRGPVRGPSFRGEQAPPPTSGEILLIDVGPASVTEARWERLADSIRLTVSTRPSAWNVRYQVLVASPTDGSELVVVPLRLDDRDASGADRWLGVIDVAGPADAPRGLDELQRATFELVRTDVIEDLEPAVAIRRHATTLGRTGDHLARRAWVSDDVDTWRTAGEAWQRAAIAWRSARDSARAALATNEAVRCFHHADDTLALRRLPSIPASSALIADDTVDLVESVTERIVAIVSAYVDAAVDDLDLLAGADRARVAIDLEVLCDSLGLVERADRARTVVDEWRRAGQQPGDDA